MFAFDLCNVLKGSFNVYLVNVSPLVSIIDCGGIVRAGLEDVGLHIQCEAEFTTDKGGTHLPRQKPIFRYGDFMQIMKRSQQADKHVS